MAILNVLPPKSTMAILYVLAVRTTMAVSRSRRPKDIAQRTHLLHNTQERLAVQLPDRSSNLGHGRVEHVLADRGVMASPVSFLDSLNAARLSQLSVDGGSILWFRRPWHRPVGLVVGEARLKGCDGLEYIRC